jgi:hypothetical protein
MSTDNERHHPSDDLEIHEKIVGTPLEQAIKDIAYAIDSRLTRLTPDFLGDEYSAGTMTMVAHEIKKAFYDYDIAGWHFGLNNLPEHVDIFHKGHWSAKAPDDSV